MTDLRNTKGFTLVETIIYIAIISGVLLTFVSFSWNISNAKNKVRAQTEVQANIRIALNMIAQKIQSAASVSTTQSVFNVDPGVLYLNMNSSTLNPTIFSLSSDNGQLQIKEGNYTTSTVTTAQVGVTNLIFTNLSVSSTKENVGINMGVSFDASSDVSYRYSQSLQTAVSVRE